MSAGQKIGMASSSASLELAIYFENQFEAQVKVELLFTHEAIGQKIMSFLDLRSLGRCIMVSKAFRNLVESNRCYWSRLTSYFIQKYGYINFIQRTLILNRHQIHALYSSAPQLFTNDFFSSSTIQARSKTHLNTILTSLWIKIANRDPSYQGLKRLCRLIAQFDSEVRADIYQINYLSFESISAYLVLTFVEGNLDRLTHCLPSLDRDQFKVMLRSEIIGFVHWVARRGLVEIYQYITEVYPDIDHLYPNFRKVTVLHEAAAFGHVDLVQYILDYQMPEPDCANVCDAEFRTPLHYAAEKGHLQVFQMIASRVVDPNPQKFLTQTSPLHEAVINQHKDIVEYLVNDSRVTKPNAVHLPCLRRRRSSTPLHSAAITGNLEIFKLITPPRDSFDYIRLQNWPKGETPLQLALMHGNYDIFEFILEETNLAGVLSSPSPAYILKTLANGDEELFKKSVENLDALRHFRGPAGPHPSPSSRYSPPVRRRRRKRKKVEE